MPSYLLRRPGGRYHFQRRLAQTLASQLGWSHLRCALRTSDSRVARRRMASLLDATEGFSQADDLDESGRLLARKLGDLVAAGPPRSDKERYDRLLIEDLVRAFMNRCRERDLPFGRIPGLVHLFKAFTEQNLPAPPAHPFGAPRAIVAAAADGDEAAPAASPALGVVLARIEARLAGLSQAAPSPAGPGEPVAQLKDDLPLAAVAARFLAAEAARRGDDKGDALYGPILRFAVAFLGDPRMSTVDADDLRRLDAALPDIPHPKGFPPALRDDLHARFLRAQANGWQELKRISETTLRLRYQRSLNKFFDWARDERLYAGPPARFAAESDELFAVLPRDRLADAEVLRFVSAPLFTGCAGRDRIWQTGPYFHQSDLYWIFLILLFSGLRTGEAPQIKLDDVVVMDYELEDGTRTTIHYIDMRPYDPAKGRVAIKELKHLKRADFSRVVPIYPLLIDLGLMERVARLRARGETRLFPGWTPHVSAKGEVRWGKAISRAFDYARRRPQINLTRANVSLYSMRHLVADWLDSINAPQRVRNRVLGHKDDSGNASGEYGGKGLLPAEQALLITEMSSPLTREMRAVLLGARHRADKGDLKRLD